MTEPTRDDLQRGNLRRMTDGQLAAEHATVATQPESETRDAYLGKLEDEYKRRGHRPPEGESPPPSPARRPRRKAQP